MRDIFNKEKRDSTLSNPDSRRAGLKDNGRAVLEREYYLKNETMISKNLTIKAERVWSRISANARNFSQQPSNSCYTGMFEANTNDQRAKFLQKLPRISKCLINTLSLSLSHISPQNPIPPKACHLDDLFASEL